MRKVSTLLTHALPAALVILSAALFAAGQSGKSGGSGQERDGKQPASATPTPSKQNARDAAPGDATAAASSDVKPVPATYAFEFTQPEFLVSRIYIEHDEAGRGRITFERRNSDPMSDPLEFSPTAIARIRGLWDALHFLETEKSYQADKDYAHLGTNRLHLKQGGRERETEFNWTSDRTVFELVTEYKNAANQAMFIFDITLARENQPLEAPKLMTQLDDYVRRKQLSDPQQLVPLLRELSTDERIPLMARNHAGRILKKLEK